MPDPSCVCDLRHSSGQCQILNPLNRARDRTHILMDNSRIHYHWATTGTPVYLFRPQQRRARACRKQSHSSDNAGSLTCWATRELCKLYKSECSLLYISYCSVTLFFKDQSQWQFGWPGLDSTGPGWACSSTCSQLAGSLGPGRERRMGQVHTPSLITHILQQTSLGIRSWWWQWPRGGTFFFFNLLWVFFPFPKIIMIIFSFSKNYYGLLWDSECTSCAIQYDLVYSSYI